jgi:hypothetical protein
VISRRTVLGVLALALLAVPLGAGAQPEGKVAQIGILSAGVRALGADFDWESVRRRLGRS